MKIIFTYKSTFLDEVSAFKSLMSSAFKNECGVASVRDAILMSYNYVYEKNGGH